MIDDSFHNTYAAYVLMISDKSSTCKYVSDFRSNRNWQEIVLSYSETSPHHDSMFPQQYKHKVTSFQNSDNFFRTGSSKIMFAMSFGDIFLRPDLRIADITCDSSILIRKDGLVRLHTSTIWYYRDIYSLKYECNDVVMYHLHFGNTVQTETRRVVPSESDLRESYTFVHLPITEQVEEFLISTRVKSLILANPLPIPDNLPMKLMKNYKRIKIVIVKYSAVSYYVLLEAFGDHTCTNGVTFEKNVSYNVREMIYRRTSDWQGGIMYAEKLMEDKYIPMYHRSDLSFSLYTDSLVFGIPLQGGIEKLTYSREFCFYYTTPMILSVTSDLTLVGIISQKNISQQIYAKKLSDRHSEFLNESDCVPIKKELKEFFKLPVSQAFLKLTEMFYFVHQLRSIQVTKALHLCELPGMFILATRKRFGDYEWRASSLNPEVNSRAFGDDYGVLRKNREKWYFGADNTGDIIACEKEFYEYAAECDFITSDAGIHEVFARPEAALERVQAAVMRILLRVKTGGTCIIKHFLPGDQNMDLVHHIQRSFEQVILYKSMLNPESLEFYLICHKKREVNATRIDFTLWPRAMLMTYSHWDVSYDLDMIRRVGALGDDEYLKEIIRHYERYKILYYVRKIKSYAHKYLLLV